MRKMVKGELTAFLSLVFLLLISLVGTVLESASIQVLKNEKRADTSRAIESVFAEYQQELFKNYHLFAIDGSYETGNYSVSNILNRLPYYGAENIDFQMEEVRILSDHKGRAFYEQAVKYEKEKTGMDKVDDLIGMSGSWNDQTEKYELYEEDYRETSKRLEQMLQENEIQLPDSDNPLKWVSQLKSLNILSVLLPEGVTLSQKEIPLADSVSKRELRIGNWSEAEEGKGAIFFNLYLMEHFGNVLNSKEGAALQYEQEYLIAGENSDKENLESVLKSLCNLRFGINYLYLLSDGEKQAEARAVASGLCALLTVPGITEVVTQGILLAWAYGESLVEVKILLAGGKISLLKNKRNWKISIEKIMSSGAGVKISDDKGDEGGMTYERYLQMMLYMKQTNVLNMRSLDLIEQNIQKTQTYFRIDNCITGLKVQAKCKLRRGITYQFFTQYHYQ